MPDFAFVLDLVRRERLPALLGCDGCICGSATIGGVTIRTACGRGRCPDHAADVDGSCVHLSWRDGEPAGAETPLAAYLIDAVMRERGRALTLVVNGIETTWPWRDPDGGE